MAVKKKLKVNPNSRIPVDMQKRMHMVWSGALEVMARTQKARALPGTEEATKVLGETIQLKAIAGKAGIDPRIARRILRQAGKKPSGRWEWNVKDGAVVEKFLRDAIGSK